jgi:hypothetical protein
MTEECVADLLQVVDTALIDYHIMETPDKRAEALLQLVRVGNGCLSLFVEGGTYSSGVDQAVSGIANTLESVLFWDVIPPNVKEILNGRCDWKEQANLGLNNLLRYKRVPTTD